MKKIFYILILCILCNNLIFGQIYFKGIVSDNDKNPVMFANVFVMGTTDGASSDSTGYFSFKANYSDTIVLMVKTIGYKDYKKVYYGITNKTIINQNITIETNTYELNQVVISSYTNLVSDKGRSTTIKSRDIKRIPGSNDDITQGLRALPGVQQIGEKEGLFIRGGDNTETNIYIDGLKVPSFYRNGADNMAQRSWFSPNLFEGTFFSSGGYSSLYGDALSGALILDSKGFPIRNTYDVNISSVGAASDMTFVSNNKKWMVNPSISYTNVLPYYSLVEQQKTFIDAPEYKNVYLNSRFKPNKKDVVKLFFAGEKSDLSFTDVNLDYNNFDQYFATDNSNIFSFLVYEKWFGEKTKLYLGTSYSLNKTNEKNEIVNQDNFDDKLYADKDNTTKKFNESKIVLTRYINNKLKINIGTDWQYNDYNQVVDEFNNNIYYNNASAFSEIEWTIFSYLITSCGIRYDYNDISNTYNLSPRASIGWLPTNNTQALFSYGIYNQIPEWDYINNKLNNIPKSSHYIFTFLHRANTLLFRAEGYYKDYRQLVTSLDDDINTTGSGYAKGVDVFLKQENSKIGVEYWISYSYLDTKRKHYDYPIKTRPEFAAEHTFNLVSKKYVPSISCYFAATYNYASGRPYFNPNLDESNFLSEKTPGYHNLSFLIANILMIKKKYILTTAFTISNPFNWKQVFSYKYSLNGQTRIAIEPPAPRFIYLGFYLSWGKDDSKQIINDLL